jgi:hypothetical protein
VLALLGLLAPAAASQEPLAGSEQHVTTARTAPAGAERSDSETFTVEAAAGASLATSGQSSPNFSFASGVGAAAGDLVVPALSRPIVFGVSSGYGDRDGGEVEKVFGFNFDQFLSFLTDVEVAGAPATGETVLSNTVVQFISPQGRNVHGNPLGAVELSVTNQWGTSESSKSYVYTPGVYDTRQAGVGRFYAIDFLGEPNSLYWLFIGTSLPGQAVTLSSFDGALEVLLNGILLFSGFTFTGHENLGFVIPPPEDVAGLAGLPLEIQMLTVTSLDPIEGSFTNLMLTIISD